MPQRVDQRKPAVDLVPRLEAAAEEVHSLEDAARAARERRDELVVAAVDEGMSTKAAACAARISQSRVMGILATGARH